MKLAFYFACIFSLNIAHAQNSDIKKMILSDVLSFDRINNFEYIDDVKYVIKFTDSEQTYRRDQILDNMDRHINVVSIDTFVDLYRVRVKFKLPFKFEQLKNDTFEYVLCRNGNKYCRINGFTISDFFQLENYQIQHLISSKFVNNNNLGKFYSKNDYDVDRTLFIALPYKLHSKYRLKLSSRPLLSSPIQQAFNAR